MEPRLTSHPARPFPRRRRAPAAAYTLVEVMLASFVMLFAISTSLLVFQNGFRALDTSRKTTLASQIMQGEMERIRMLNWTQVQALPAEQEIDFENLFPRNTAAEQKILDLMKKTFVAKRTTATPAGYDNEVRQVTVTITWNGIDGQPHRRSSQTQYCKNGLYAYYYRVP